MVIQPMTYIGNLIFIMRLFILLTSYINGFSLQLNRNINASLSITQWVQNIVRVKKQNNTYMINFLDNIWNVTTQNLTLNNFKGNGRSIMKMEEAIIHMTPNFLHN